MLEKAYGTPADVLVFDLEDAVPPAQKEEARQTVRGVFERMDPGDKEIGVRVNALDTGLTERDIAAVIHPNLHTIHLPKVEEASDVKYAVQIMERCEREAGRTEPLALVVNIETPLGVENAYAIARASKRIKALQFGAGDLCTMLGQPATTEFLHYPRTRVLYAAVAAGVMPLDTVYVNFRDLEGYRQDAQVARKMGFVGKSCIHPDQIPIANEVFSPSEEEVEEARKIIAAFEKSEREGIGALDLDGRMIDIPFVIRARQVVAAAESLRRSGGGVGETGT